MKQSIEKVMSDVQKLARETGVDAVELLKRTQERLLTENENVRKKKDEEKQALEKKKEEEHQNDAWERVQLARHINRPTALQYIEMMSEQYVEFHGDRCAGDDAAMVGGICTIAGIHFTFVANQKGSNMKENIRRNYGMAHPEGYRKALRLMKQAEKFGRPVLTLIDTSGAYPGIASEERGIGEAIARNLRECSVLETPIICVIIGEGGSGGALGIGIGDRIFMLENSVYSVISPEGFASILLRDAKRAQEAAALMKMTAKEVLSFDFIDGIIPEAEGGAHNDIGATAGNIREVILHSYAKLKVKDLQQLVQERSKKIIDWTRGLQTKNDTTRSLLEKVKHFFVE